MITVYRFLKVTTLTWIVSMIELGPCYGQVFDTSVFRARYAYKVRPDSAKEEMVLIDVFDLEAGQKFTKFYSYNKQVFDSVFKRQYDLQPKQEGVPLRADMRSVPNGSSKIILRQESRNYFFISEKLGLNTYRYIDSIQNLQWRIKTDTATISGFLCTKASVRFRGRNYNAWFSSSVPVSSGPYLFYGLPGLIIKIEEEHKRFEFELTSLEQLRMPIEIVHLRFTQISRNEYRRLSMINAVDPEALLNSQGMTMGPGTVDGQPEIPSMHKKGKYNPIELE